MPNMSLKKNPMPSQEPAVRRRNFDEVALGYTEEQAVDEAALIAQFPEADLILLEGFKYSAWPKLEVVRAGNSEVPVSNPATLLALVTDLPLELPGVRRIPFGDAAAAAQVILDYVNRGGECRA